MDNQTVQTKTFGTLKNWALNNDLKPPSVAANLKRKGYSVTQRTLMTTELINAYHTRRGNKASVSVEKNLNGTGIKGNGEVTEVSFEISPEALQEAKNTIATWKPGAMANNEPEIEVAPVIPDDEPQNKNLPVPPSMPEPPTSDIEPPTKFVGGRRVVDHKKWRKMQREAAGGTTGSETMDRNEQIAMNIFTNPLISILMVIVVLVADGVSAAFLSSLVFEGIWVQRSFGIVGFAVGYIAIRSVIRYESDQLAGAFFLVQLLLHLSAFGVFDAGLTIGQKIGLTIIAVAISLSSVGFSLSMRDIVNK